MSLDRHSFPVCSLALAALLLITGSSTFGQDISSKGKHQSRHLEFNIPGTDGRTHTAREFENSRAAVFFFVAPECPISNRYAPEIARIVADYAKQGFSFYGVHSDPEIDREVARKHAKDYGYQFPVLLDPVQTLAEQFGVTLTPTVVVVSPVGQVLYRGRIDNRYLDFGVFRNVGITSDLRNALEAIRDARAVAEPTTKSIGCAIPAARRDSHSGPVTSRPE